MDARLRRWAATAALIAEDAHAHAAWFSALAGREEPGSEAWRAAVAEVGNFDQLAACWDEIRADAEARATSAGAG